MKLTSKDHFDLGIIWYNQLSKLENLLEISRENWTFLKGNQRNNRILRNKSLKKFLSFWVIPVPPRVCCDFGMWFFLENGNINRSFDLGPSENHKGVNQLTQQLLARAVNGEDADPQTVWRRNQHLTSKLLVDKATYTYAYKVLNMITLITWKLYVLKKLQIWVYLCC